VKAILRKIRQQLRLLWYKRNYFLKPVTRPTVPINPLPYFPNGFSIQQVGNTGLRVVDNFLTAEEAQYFVAMARDKVAPSRVIIDGKPVLREGRSSSHAIVFHRNYQDPHVLPLLVRGAALVGVPMDHAEQVYVTRYKAGELYHGHYDMSHDFLSSDRLCTILIYLNDLTEEQGGATYFRDLNVAVKPKLGRAVCWTNTNPDGSVHHETMHAALPPQGEDTEKWVTQLWFRPYRMHRIHDELEPLQTRPGRPLTGSEHLPEGIWMPSQGTAATG